MDINDPDYQRAFTLVKRCVDSWNPYQLIMPDGENSDEFVEEVHVLVRNLHRMRSPADTAHRVAQIFSDRFADPARFTVESCSAVGARLFRELEEAGLV
jgi:hypothetical protein